MVSCPNCTQRLPTGQAELTESEKQRLPLGNQNTKWNIIKWRAVKGAALYFDVTDWTAKVDSELSYDENMQLMMMEGTNPDRPGGPTMREMETP